MRISVIIPCYNAERYLAACLESLLAQSMQDFEAILVDDGSKDDTAQIACEYARRDERVLFLHQENAGVSAARNAGLDMARGEWVLFVDADDLLPHNALDTLLSYTAQDVDLVVSQHETFDISGAKRVDPDTRWMDLAGEKKRHAAALRLIEGDRVLNIMCNKLHRRSLIVREGLRLDCGVRIAEDALFNLEAVLCGNGIAFCDQITYRYRIHAGSATQQQKRSEFEQHLPWFLSMQRMLCRRDVYDRYYSAFFFSMVLRLHKDGGVPFVMRAFSAKIRPIVLELMPGDKRSLMTKLLILLTRWHLFPAVYPLVYLVQAIGRRGQAALMRIRIGRTNHE